MSPIADALRPFLEKRYVAGIVALAATGDRILACEAMGFADLAAQRPMTPGTMFWIASQTKPITGTALMMLVDEGKVNVDDPVEKYLPEFKGQMVVVEKDDEHVLLRKPRHPILVREILSHTSGLPYSSPIEIPTLDHIRLRNRVRSYAATPLLFEPGSAYSYSNAGSNTAGRIIEVVSGLAFEDFLADRLLRPLGMTDTTFWPSEAQMARMAKVYRTNVDKSGLEEAKIHQLSYPFSARDRKAIPAGGLFSTAADCAKFCQMILNGGEAGGRRYISETSLRQMTSKQTGPELEPCYGFGWDATGGKFGHGAAAKTNMYIDPHKGLITVFLIQHVNDWPNDEARQVGNAFVAAAETLV